MKRTNKYNLAYFEEGDFTSGVVEMQRWETIDTQLNALYQIMGNGVISGWNLIANNDLSISVTPGSGNVAFVSAATTRLTPVLLTSNTRNYIYATLTSDTYWTQNVNFITYLLPVQSTNPNTLYLGYADTGNSTVTNINTDGVEQLGFIGLIQNLVKEHRHIGGTSNPQPVNLATDVQGTLNINHLPDLDASIVKTGVFDASRIPLLDHRTELTGVGNLTHAQLDSYIQTLVLADQTLMGEVSTTNLLQLILAIKHVYPDIDQYLMNEIAYIPGISSDDIVDTVNTTAIVDTRPYCEGGQHTITGSNVQSTTLRLEAWQTENDFEEGEQYNVYITGSSVSLKVQTNTLLLDNFSGLTGWSLTTQNLSTLPSNLILDSSTYVIPPNSGKISIGSENVEIILLAQKAFTAMDWSGYKYLTFYVYTSSVQHGDLFFYLSDSSAGTQNSYIKILNRNAPTISQDTQLNGWQEVTIDITNYTRTAINQIGFYVSTQSGWDTSKGFDLNIDDIFLSSGNLYVNNGHIRFTFGNDFPYDFYRLRWDAFIPSDPESTGVSFLVRSRYANTLAGLPLSIWSDYSSVSGALINLPDSTLFKFIEIECYFGASLSLTRSATLNALYLDYYVDDTIDSIAFSKKTDWETGSLFNINLNTVTNSLSISDTQDINSYIYGSNGNAIQLDSGFNEIYKLYGTSLPYTTNQALNNLPPSLGTITGVSRGNNGNIWVSDIDNDRIVELDKSGHMVTGFYGSFLTAPIDPYGTEDYGPGSNTNVSTTIQPVVTGTDLYILHSVYNKNNGNLYVVFNQDLENIYSSTTFKPERFYIKVAGYRIYLNESTISLLGVDKVKYNLWNAAANTAASTSSAYFVNMNQFTFNSHTLVFNLDGANKTLLNYLLGNSAPSVIISSPLSNQFTDSDLNIYFPTYDYNQEVLNIQVTLDSIPTIVHDNYIGYSGLSNGNHTLAVQLLDSSLNPITNIGANVSSNFIVQSYPYTNPHIYINSPNANQVYSSGIVQIDFTVENFAVISGGQHLQYTVDGGIPTDYYSTSPIIINNLTQGKHIVSIYTVDQNGNILSYTYSTASVEFIVGNNYNVNLYAEQNAIYNSDRSIGNDASKDYTGIGNVTFCNIYAPIDIQLIPFETDQSDVTILVGKLRSPSWINGLSGKANETEMLKRISNSSNVTILSNVSTANLIYGTNYLNGHSVVQLDMNGDTTFTNNAARFSNTKENAIKLLGSVEKSNPYELFIGDSINKRAIITYTNAVSEVPSIIWEYDSDRYISDFHLVPKNNVIIGLSDGNISMDSVFVTTGTTVTWKNNSSNPIAIYSGYTSYDIFNANPDLNLYGKDFQSGTLQVGDTYQFTFDTNGSFNWFVYPSILTAQITVSTQRLSSTDNYIILENDGLLSPFSSRIIKVNSSGDVLWDFGNSYLVLPRDARPMSDGSSILIST